MDSLYVRLTLTSNSFIFYEGGIKFSFPQIELTLAFLGAFWCWFELTFGAQFGCRVLTYGPASFFQTHFLPYWYAAIAVFSFYLAEIASITSSKKIVTLFLYLTKAFLKNRHDCWS